MDDKRNTKRKIIKVEINCLVNLGKGSIAGLSYNISEGGICLISKKPVIPGSTVDLDFSIPFNHRIVAVAEVKWNREIESGRYSSGLQFMTIKEEELKQLKQYLLERQNENGCIPADISASIQANRRRNDRVEMGIFINYMTVEAYAMDISESGIRISAKEKLELNNEIQLTFFLPDLSCIMVTGYIKWAEECEADLFEYGIEFIEKHDKDLDAIRKYMTKRM